MPPLDGTAPAGKPASRVALVAHKGPAREWLVRRFTARHWTVDELSPRTATAASARRLLEAEPDLVLAQLNAETIKFFRTLFRASPELARRCVAYTEDEPDLMDRLVARTLGIELIEVAQVDRYL